MKTRSTITDIAKQAGVGRATVSLVLRGKKAALRISDRTQKRVMAAAKELDYRPNILARGLSGGLTHSVGIVWNTTVPEAGMSMMHDLSVKVRNRQYAPYTRDYQNSLDDVLEALHDFMNRGVDGAIVELGFPEMTDKTTAEILLQLKKFKAAVIVSKVTTDLQIDHVVHDRFASIKAVADHFVRIGRTRPSVVSTDYGTKVKAFKSQLNEYDIYLPKENIIDLKSVTELSHGYCWGDYTYKVLEHQFSDGKISFDCLLCDADEQAVAAIAWLDSKGLRVPQDVAVVGFNNLDCSKYMKPPLASVERRDEEVACIVGKMLFARLDEPSLPVQKDSVSMGFVWRESAGQEM